MDEKGNTQICEVASVLELDAEPDAPPPTYLIVLRGGNPGAMLPLGPGVNWIGRGSDNTIQLPEPTVSRQHALLQIEPDGRAVLGDQHSTNGTFLNGTRLQPETRVALADGDRLRIGSTIVLKFSRPDPCEETFHREIFERSVRDPLTGLFHRAYFIDRVGPLVQRSAAQGLGMAVLMIDVDHFKRVNDTFGHGVGDAVLRKVAGVLRRVTRSEDLVARYGGEEFVMALPCPTLARAAKRAERVRRILASRRFQSGGIPLRVTVSIGVAYASALRPRSVQALLTSADAHLYQAKENGRNCVVCMTVPAGQPPDDPLTIDGELPATAERFPEPPTRIESVVPL